jgi:hypothetical protein
MAKKPKTEKTQRQLAALKAAATRKKNKEAKAAQPAPGISEERLILARRYSNATLRARALANFDKQNKI